MEKRNLTCIVCPIGCALEVTLDNGAVCSVIGNTCPRGAVYAQNECTHPTRVLTTTVRVTGGEKPLVSVKTQQPIPKERLFDAMKAVNAAAFPAPIALGQVLIPNLCGTAIPLVATSTVVASAVASADAEPQGFHP